MISCRHLKQRHGDKRVEITKLILTDFSNAFQANFLRLKSPQKSFEASSQLFKILKSFICYFAFEDLAEGQA